MASKGKAVMSGGKDSYGKKKQGVKRKNRDVLQFFEDAADEFDADDGSDWSDFFDDDDFFGDFNEKPKVESVPEKRDQVPFFPKEEELSGDELEKMLEERYRSGSGFVRYAEDDYDNKRSVDKSFFMPSVVEPKIWKVKCKVGREKNVVFCLIQKYSDLKVLGTKLQIISTFAVEHVKGFVFIEAEKQTDVTEACYQLADVYATLVIPVPSNEVGQLLNVRRKNNEVKEGTWARVKNGIYRGDLTQVVAVNNERKRATVKLIPRVDVQALMEKYGGGGRLKRPRNSVPTARLISSRELAELRPLMQYRRDRDTGKVFEFLDGLMLKDGFLFKKVSFDSLAFWDVNPTEEELQKFALPSHDESDNVEWLSQLYGEQKKTCEVKIGKGGGKGEGTSGSNDQSGFEVHDLVLFGKRDFGMVIGMEKDEKYKIIKDSPEGSVTLNLGPKELKYVSVDTKFTASDHRMRTISVNDTVRMLDGPSKGKQGIVKQIYRGIIFVYDENDVENAYFCGKSKMSEKVKHSDAAGPGKDEGGQSTFEDVPSSPKSPLSPKKPWQMRENGSDDRGDKGEMFSVGQSLRIRVGPLKGYLCRVLAVRYSEVTVKLDSKQKVLTVKREHLAEVRDKNSTSTSDDAGLGSSFKPFDLLGADGGAGDWLQGASGSADAGAGGGGWNVGSSNETSTWSTVSSWGASAQEGTTATAVPDSVNNDSGSGDASWLTKVGNSQNSDTDAGWGKPSGAGASSSWGKPKDSVEDPGWGKPSGAVASDTWGKPKDPVGDPGWGKPSGSGASDTWGKPKDPVGDPAASWNVNGSSSGQGSADNVVATDKGNVGSWGNKDRVEDAGGWNKLSSSGDAGSSGWGKQKACDVNANTEKSTDHAADDSWGKAAGGSKSGSVENKWGSSSGSPANDKKEWGNSAGVSSEKNSSGTTWNNAPSGSSSWGAKSWDKGKDVAAEGASWGKPSESQDGITGNTGGGRGSWQRSGNSENDQGFGQGRGFGGRGRGGFGRGRDNAGRGRGRSDGRGQGSNWRSEGQGGGGGSSWGNSGGGNGGGSSWTASGGDGGSSWGKPQSDGGSAGGGGSSWGKPQSDGGSAGGGGSSWGKPQSDGSGGGGGGSSWGKSQSGGSGAGDGGSSWGKPQSGGTGAGDGGSSWGKSQSGGSGAGDGGSSWGKSQSGGSGAGGGGGGGSSWGKSPQSEEGNKAGGGGSSWGGGNNDQTNLNKAAGGWNEKKSEPSSGNASGNAGEGGASWGAPRTGGSSWGNAQTSGNSGGGGGGWGK